MDSMTCSEFFTKLVEQLLYHFLRKYLRKGLTTKLLVDMNTNTAWQTLVTIVIEFKFSFSSETIPVISMFTLTFNFQDAILC